MATPDSLAWEYAKSESLDKYVNTVGSNPKISIKPKGIYTDYNYDPSSFRPEPKNELGQLDPGLRTDFRNRILGNNASAATQGLETVSNSIPQNNSDLSEYILHRSRPSTASPPPTPATTTARAARPATAEPPIAAPAVATAESLARNGGIAAGLEFGIRLVSGQPIDKAALGAGGAAAGAVIGGAVLSELGPVGMYVGSSVGANIGGRIADFIYDEAHPAPAEVKEAVKIGPAQPPPFNGGQGVGVLYNIQYHVTQPRPGDPRGELSYDATPGRPFYGPILGTRLKQQADNPNNAIFEVLCYGYGAIGNLAGEYLSEAKWLAAGDNPFVYADQATMTVTSVSRDDGRPDTDGNLPTLVFPVPTDTRSPDSVQHPANQTAAPPSATPAAGKQPAQNNYVPGGLKSRENGTPRGDNPNWIAHGVPAGSVVSDNMPGLLMSPLPSFSLPDFAEPEPQGVFTGEPSKSITDQSFPTVTARSYAPGGPQVTPSTGYIGEWSGNFSSNPSDPLSSGSTGISGLPQTTKQNTPADGQKPTPVSTSSPGATTTPSTTDTTISNLNKEVEKFKDEISGKVLELGTALAAVTVILQGITKQTSQDALENAAAAGTCKTTQPGGCTNNLVNDAANNTNKKIDANALAQDGALAKLLADSEALKGAVGVAEFPATLPASIISKKGAAVPGTTKVTNLAQFQAWSFQRFDEVMGQFTIPMSIEGPKGTKNVEIPNMSEGIGELFGMGIAQIQAIETVTNITTRNIIETGQIKQQVYKNMMQTQAMMDYMGFETKEVARQMPLLFKPNADNLFGMLSEHQQTVKGVEYSGKMNLQKIFARLLDAASIIKAVFWRKVDTSKGLSETKKEITKNFKQSSALGKKVNEPKKDKDGKDDFDKFLENAETGFKSVTGDDTPYDDAYKNRPKITRLKKDNPPNTKK